MELEFKDRCDDDAAAADEEISDYDGDDNEGGDLSTIPISTPTLFDPKR